MRSLMAATALLLFVQSLRGKLHAPSSVPPHLSAQFPASVIPAGGNSKTSLVACVSPCEDSAQESHSTLVFAQGAKRIRNKVRARAGVFLGGWVWTGGWAVIGSSTPCDGLTMLGEAKLCTRVPS